MTRKQRIAIRNTCLQFLSSKGVFCKDLNYPVVAHQVEKLLGYSVSKDCNPYQRIALAYTKITGLEVKICTKKADKKERVDFSQSMNEKIKEFYASYQWRRLRYLTLVRFGKKCAACGRSGEDVVIQVDHIKPIRKFWNLRLKADNVQPLCELCNHGKGNWDETDWIAKEIVETPASTILHEDLREYLSQWYFWDDLQDQSKVELVDELILLFSRASAG